MKYFAKLGLNSKVIKVYSVADHKASTEKDGIEYLHKCTNYPFWVQTFKDRSQCCRIYPFIYPLLSS